MGVQIREKPPGSGVWWVFINHHGRRKSKKVGDRVTAIAVAKKIEAKLILEDFSMAPKEKSTMPTFQEYAVIWLETLIKTTRRQSTYERYGSILAKHVYPIIGQTPIDQVNRADVRNLLLNVHGKGLSKSMVGLVRDVISGPMGYALDEEIIKANPITGVLKRLNLKRDKRGKVDPFTHDEVAVFLAACNEQPFKEYHPFFMTAFRTGARLGELLGLQWGDIDWHGQFIEIRRSYKLGRMSPTKTGVKRRVDMSDQLREVLYAFHQRRKVEGLRTGKGGAVEIVFHRDGKPMEQNFIRRIFKRVLEKAGLRDIRFHDIRHSFASLLLTDGASPVYVKEQLGHHSIQMTVDVYGHLIPSSNRDIVNRLDAHPSAPYTHPEKKESL
jgi:integrase